jgi:hypothetical protein
MTIDVADKCAEDVCQDSGAATAQGCALTTEVAAKQAACALKKARELTEEITDSADPKVTRVHMLLAIAEGWRAIATHVPLARSGG